MPKKKKATLKILREARNLSLEDLALQSQIPLSELKSIERNPLSSKQKNLSAIAHALGLSSEELFDLLRGAKSKVSNSNYYIFCSQFEDGWWGHLGIHLKGQKNSTWHPITLGSADYLSEILKDSETEGWISAETLDNRILIFRIESTNKIWLLDDAADEPKNDWNIDPEKVMGRSGEFYKGLERYSKSEWYYGTAPTEHEENPDISDAVISEVEKFTDFYDMTPDDAHEFAFQILIHHTDGNFSKYDADDDTLSELVSLASMGVLPNILDLSCNDHELFIMTENISMIEIPKRRVMLASRGLKEGAHLE